MLRAISSSSAVLIAVACTHAPAPRSSSVEPEVAAPPRSFHLLTTGNGHGFQMFDETQRKVIAFQDHPYRFVRAPEDLRENGPERRNLLEDFSLGTVRGDVVQWLESTRGSAGFVEDTNIIETDAGDAKAYV